MVSSCVVSPSPIASCGVLQLNQSVQEGFKYWRLRAVFQDAVDQALRRD
jgi:hypothetical protein